jgi:hypothetical protein
MTCLWRLGSWRWLGFPDSGAFQVVIFGGAITPADTTSMPLLWNKYMILLYNYRSLHKT